MLFPRSSREKHVRQKHASKLSQPPAAHKHRALLQIEIRKSKHSPPQAPPPSRAPPASPPPAPPHASSANTPSKTQPPPALPHPRQPPPARTNPLTPDHTATPASGKSDRSPSPPS